MNEEEMEMEMPRRYKPPGLTLMMEILNLLAGNGKVKATMTVTLSTSEDDDASA